MSAEKKCIQCGAELPEDAMFCPECGTRQPAVSQEANDSDNPDTTAEPAKQENGQTEPASTKAVEFPAPPTAGATPSAAGTPVSAPPPLPDVGSATASFDPFATATASRPADPAQSFQYTMPAPPPDPAQPPYAQPAASQQGYPQPTQPGPYAQQNWAQPQQAPAQSWQQAPPQAPANGQPPAAGKGAKKKAAKAEAAAMQSPDASAKGKLPVATLVILGLVLVGLLVWFLMYNSAKLPPFDFSAATANGVVFAFLLMTILAIAGAALFRFNMRGSKLAVLGDVLLVVVFLVMFYGISVTMFKETNLFYKLFISITGAGN